MKYTPAELAEVFRETLTSVSRVFSEQGQPWMLVGGLAVGGWTEPRATKDCDFAISLPADVEALVNGLRDVDIAVSRADFSEAVDGGVVRARLQREKTPSVVIDLLCAGTPFELEALGRRRLLDVLGVNLFAATPDDLVIYKLIAGRPQDLADIDRLIRFGRSPEDPAYVDRWVREWGVEERWQRCVEAAKR